MAKKKYTLTLDPAVVEQAKAVTDNLSETVTNLLKQMVSEHERSMIRESAKEYNKHMEELRKKIGLFGEDQRKF